MKISSPRDMCPRSGTRSPCPAPSSGSEPAQPLHPDRPQDDAQCHGSGPPDILVIELPKKIGAYDRLAKSCQKNVANKKWEWDDLLAKTCKKNCQQKNGIKVTCLPGNLPPRGLSRKNMGCPP